MAIKFIMEDKIVIICHYEENTDETVRQLVEAVKMRLGSRGISVCDDSSAKNEDGMTGLLREADCYFMNTVFIREKYVLVVVSDAILKNIDFLIELYELEKLYFKSRIVVFTVLSEISAGELPLRAKWLEKTDVFEIGSVSEIRTAVSAIAYSVWFDKVRNCNKQVIGEFVTGNRRYKGSFFQVLADMGRELEAQQIKSKLMLFIVLCRYMDYKMKLSALDDFVDNFSCINALFMEMSMGVPMTKADYDMAGCCLTDIFNKLRNSNIQLLY